MAIILVFSGQHSSPSKAVNQIYLKQAAVELGLNTRLRQLACTAETSQVENFNLIWPRNVFNNKKSERNSFVLKFFEPTTPELLFRKDFSPKKCFANSAILDSVILDLAIFDSTIFDSAILDSAVFDPTILDSAILDSAI